MAKRDSGEKDYTIQVLMDADEVLGALASFREPAGLSEISAACGLSRNKVFRILRTLEKLRYVEALGDHYRLGMQLALYWARTKARLESERAEIDRTLKELEVTDNGRKD